MNKRRTLLAAVMLAGAVLGLGAADGRGQEKKVDLPVVTYDELGKKVRAQAGKVVLVYLWSFT